MTETDFVKEALQVNRGVIGILVVLVIPFMNLILSIMVLFHSYKKIKNPKEIYSLEIAINFSPVVIVG